MSLLLYFAAFPGLAIAAGIHWYKADHRYIDYLVAASSYNEPTLEQTIERGPITAYRQMFKDRAESDAKVRRGELGPEALRLLVAERRAFHAALLSIPIGIVTLVVLTRVLPRAASAADSTADQVVVVLTLVVGWVVIGALIVRSLVLALRTNRPRVLAAAYLMGLIGLVVGGAIAIPRIMQGV